MINLSDYFTPRSYQLPILDAWKNKGFKRIMAILPRRCLGGESQILMSNGSYKLLRDIRKGDRILSWDGSKIVRDTVKEIWKTSKKKTKIIKSSYNLPIITSEDHLFANSSQDSSIIYWVKASELEKKHMSNRRLLSYRGVNGAPQTLVKHKFKISDGNSEELYDLETEKNHNFFANGYLVHNSGKDVVAFNMAVYQCLMKRCYVYYIFKTYSDAKKVIWDTITMEGKKFSDFIPKKLLASTNASDLKYLFTNGSYIQLVGSDKFNSLRGTNPYGLIFSEYAYQQPAAFDALSPAVAAQKGWVFFITTPNGRQNHLYDLYQEARDSSDWHLTHLTVEDTKHISKEELEKERLRMGEDKFMQEYYCSFEIGVEGAHYAKYMQNLRMVGQVCEVPYDPSYLVNTAWDLGVDDYTAIVFFQVIGKSIHIIDAYANTYSGLEHYAKILREKPYQYDRHIAPPDMNVFEEGMGQTRYQKMEQLGFLMEIAPRHSKIEGTETVKSTLPRCFFDKKKTKELTDALECYSKVYDRKLGKYIDNTYNHTTKFVSDWADAFRYMCVSLFRLNEISSGKVSGINRAISRQRHIRIPY